MKALIGPAPVFTERFGVRGTVGYIRMFTEDEGVNLIRVGGGVVFGF